MLNLQRLAVLREVAAQGSFTRAAETLAFTQSAVSQQIAALEREAGTSLIERRRDGVRLTEAGRILVDAAEEVLGRLAAAEHALTDHVGLRAGRLRLAAFESAGATLVPPAVRTFHRQHPGIDLGVVQMEPAEASKRLTARELDLAIVYDLEPSTGVLDEELALTYLFEDRYDAVLSRNHPLAKRERLSLSDLSAETWINTTPRDLCHELILSSCERAGFRPRVACEIDEIATSQALVATGIGVTLLPRLALEHPHRGVRVRSLGRHAPVRRVLAATPGTASRPPAVEAMLSVLTELASEAPQRARSGRASISR
jgi:DNA-binding transcriptional LysR family regulator